MRKHRCSSEINFNFKTNRENNTYSFQQMEVLNGELLEVFVEWLAPFNTTSPKGSHFKRETTNATGNDMQGPKMSGCRKYIS